jgi:hypothetical protein
VGTTTPGALLDIGTSTTLANVGLHVGVNSRGNATLVVDNTGGQGDIFAASSSGTPRFKILSDGSIDVGLGNVNSGGTIANDTGLKLNGNLRLTDAFSGSGTYIVPQNGFLEVFNGGSIDSTVDIGARDGSNKLRLSANATNVQLYNVLGNPLILFSRQEEE